MNLYLKGLYIKQPLPHNGYPFNLAVVRNLERLNFTSPVVFFVGENGAGKSTLLEAIAVNCGFNAEGGSRNFNFSTAATHSILHAHLTVIKGPYRPRDGYFLRAESFYNIATEIEKLDEEDGKLIASYGGTSLHRLSHGESFRSLMMNRFRGQGLYLMDEPEAALSPVSQLSLLVRMAQLVNEDSQLVISTHSPLLMAYPEAQIFVINEDSITETTYEQTEHYQITKQFLNAPQKMLRELLQKEVTERIELI